MICNSTLSQPNPTFVSANIFVSSAHIQHELYYMKKLLLLSASCLMLLSACKKNNNAGETNSEPEAKKYDVTFKVDDFSQAVTGYSLSSKHTLDVGDTLKNYATWLYYRVYNSAGGMVNTIDQTSANSTFGTITDKLKPGTYNVYIAASRTSLTTTGNSTDFDNSAISNPSGWDSNTFAKQISVTIGADAVNQSVRLDRVIGGLDINLTDAIPSNAAKVTVVLQNESNYIYYNGSFANRVFATVTKDFPLTTADVGKTNKKFSINVGNTASNLTVIIRAYDANNSLINEKTVSNVRCYQNKKTALTGALFPTALTIGSSFTVTVNPVWGSAGAQINF
jgi:hypothetical protein